MKINVDMNNLSVVTEGALEIIIKDYNSIVTIEDIIIND